jgi:transglutaminase-like putative cysteine protease
MATISPRRSAAMRWPRWPVGRTALVYVLPALTIALAWVRIENPRESLPRVFLLVAIALAPALVRPLRFRLPVLAGALVLGSWLALGASIATPGRLVARLRTGGLEFYDVDLQFDPAHHPRMYGALLAAVFLFCLVLGLALAARRPVLAGFAVAFGAGWPATLLRGGNELLLGGLILAAVLVILTGLRPAVKSALAPALGAGGLVLACALALASSPAVAKGEFLHWQTWDLYTKPGRGVDVSYVWSSNYSGLDWPKKRTVVLKVKAPEEPLMYWRATTLDAFVGDNWIEDLVATDPAVFTGDRAELTNDPLLPRSAKRRTTWVRQEVTIEALRDGHLVGADEPVAYAPRGITPVTYARGGTALVTPGQDRGHTYSVWSSVRNPTPRQLARSKPRYPSTMSIAVDKGVYVPPFGTPGRDLKVQEAISVYTAPYLPLYREAKRVVGRARTPYAAVVALESWFRDSGRFTYDQHPATVPGVPPLVSFVTRTRHGYCQHFAGAMALMLRYLGIPAHVAGGFSSGTYDGGTWTVTDHDAHAWVEVWFQGYGWLPFDPTPGRGRLGASYSASSDSFDASSAAALVGAGTAIQRLLRNEALNSSGVRGEHARSVPVPTGGGHRTLRLLGVLLLVLVSLGTAIFLAKLVRRRSRYLTRDPRRVAAACRRELVEILLDQRVQATSSATFRELGELLDEELAVGADALVADAESARFASPPAAAMAAARARAEARELRQVLRKRLSIVERVAGALSLRSLRSA